MESETRRKESAILKVLADAGQPMGSTVLAKSLKHLGIDLRQRMVRYYLEELDRAGLTENLGRAGRKITPEGLSELEKAASLTNGGAIATRTFIPHRCHSAIGVLGAVSVATACLIDGSPAAEIAATGEGAERQLSIEHPTGEMTVVATIGEAGTVERAAILRTARKLFDGVVFGD